MPCLTEPCPICATCLQNRNVCKIRQSDRCKVPYGCEEWEPHEYQVATHYYNVMPNCNAYAGLRDYKDAAKSIAWYTILSKSLFMRIEPQVWERLAAQYPEITVKTQANGVSVIRIDELPDVGDASEQLTLNYQALNEALRPVIKAVPNRLHHLYDVPHFDAVKTYYWTHRWDKATAHTIAMTHGAIPRL